MEHLHLGQGEVERGERGHDQVGGAARVGAVAGDAPVRQVDEQAHVRPLAADAHVRQVTGQVGAADCTQANPNRSEAPKALDCP